jgi:hypothetical protein
VKRATAQLKIKIEHDYGVAEAPPVFQAAGLTLSILFSPRLFLQVEEIENLIRCGQIK